MSSNSNYAYRIEEYPNSMLWVAVPSVLLVSAYFIRRWYKSYQLRVYGIGRGAKGFQTNVGKVRITPEIAERIRRGEDVSPAEIEAASKRMDELEKAGQLPSTPQKKPQPPPQVWEDEKPFVDERTPREVSPVRRAGRTPARRQSSSSGDQANEWLPDHITASNTKKRRGRKA
ncbi:hypothetical protein BKA70DRAFT_1104684 [Coprinopsis sp. MPI-PUGE-AT-0042]|nr:hypothetical protein BKA70DRAFT_1104684 [Coprinopsis sp. MPI-PUGE-AT-0042]